MINNIETPIAVTVEKVTIDDKNYTKETYEDGTYAYRDEDGNVNSIYYPNGYTKTTALEEGDVLDFYDDGKIKSIKSCNTYSSYTVLHDNGETYESNPQYDYKLINAQNYNENGIIEDAILSNGTEITYYENGYCEDIITADEDIIKFDENGNISSLQSGGKHSSFSFYHANGEHWQSDPKDDYTKIEEQTWYESGKVKSRDYFGDSYTSYYENGYIENYYGADGDIIEFDENGNLTSIYSSGKHESFELQHANGETWKSNPQYDYTNIRKQKWQEGNVTNTSVDVNNEEIDKMVKERAHWLCEQFIEANNKRLEEIQSLNKNDHKEYVKDMFERLGHGHIYDNYCIVAQLNSLQDVCDSSGNLNGSYQNTTNCANFITNMRKKGYGDCFTKNPKKEDIHPGDMIFTPRDKNGNYHVVSVKEVYQDENGETHIIVNSFNNDKTREFNGGKCTVFNTEKYMEKTLYKELEQQNFMQQEQNDQYIASNNGTRRMEDTQYAEMTAYLTRGMPTERDEMAYGDTQALQDVEQTATQTTISSQTEEIAEVIETSALQEEINTENSANTSAQASNDESKTDEFLRTINHSGNYRAELNSDGNIDVYDKDNGYLLERFAPNGQVLISTYTNLKAEFTPEGHLESLQGIDDIKYTFYPNGHLATKTSKEGEVTEYPQNKDLPQAESVELDNNASINYENGKLSHFTDSQGWSHEISEKGVCVKVSAPDGRSVSYYENYNIKSSHFPDEPDRYYNINETLKKEVYADGSIIDYDDNGLKHRTTPEGIKVDYDDNDYIQKVTYPEGDEIGFGPDGSLDYIKSSGKRSSYTLDIEDEGTHWFTEEKYDYTQIKEQKWEKGKVVSQTMFEIEEQTSNNNISNSENDATANRVEHYPNGNIKYEEWNDGSKNYYYESGSLQRAERDDMIVDYYENGNYKRIDNKDGNVVEYYENGNIKTAEYPEGDILNFDEKGNLTHVVASGAHSSYDISTGDNQSWTSDPQYDYTQIADQTFENGKLVKEVKFSDIKPEPSDEIVNNSFDLPSQQEQPAPAKTTTKTDEESEKTYNENGALIYERYPSGAYNEYYENGYIKTHHAPAGDVIDFDENGKPTHIKSSGKYNSYELTHANGKKWHSPALRDYTKIKEQTWENGRMTGIERFTRQERIDNYNKYHDENGNIISSMAPKQPGIINELADLGDDVNATNKKTSTLRENKTEDATLKWYENGQIKEEVLDSGLSRQHSEDGKLIRRSYGDNYSYTFYPNGEIKTITSPDGNTTQLEENTNITQVKEVKLPNGATIHYDSEGRIASEELKDGRKITYSAQGNIESYEWPNGEKATYYETGELKTYHFIDHDVEYYKNGKLKEADFGDGSQIKFDEKGNTTYIKSSGKSKKFRIEEDEGKVWESDDKYDYREIKEQTFDKENNSTNAKFSDGTERTFDEQGKIKSEKTFDEEGNLTSIKTYDDNGNIKKYKSDSPNAEYHENGYLKTYSTPDGDVLEFDDRGNITHIQSSGKASSYNIEHPNGEHWQSSPQYDYTEIKEQTYVNGELKEQIDQDKVEEEKKRKEEEKKRKEEEREQKRQERRARRLERIARLRALRRARFAAQGGADNPVETFMQYKQGENNEHQSAFMQWIKSRQAQNN